MQQQYIDLLVDALLDEGFTVEEAEKIIGLQEKYQERRANEGKSYQRFVRWMVERGIISDW